MKERVKEVFLYLWGIIYPILIYLVILNVLAFVIVAAFGEETYKNHAMLTSLAAMAMTIPWLLFLYSREKERMADFFSRRKKPNVLTWTIMLLASFFLALLLNLTMALFHLQEAFPEYQETAGQMYSEHGVIVLLVTLVAAPVLEELMFRGVCFLRVRKLAGKGMTILLSGLLFGVYHMNLVQFIYAFFMGMFFALLYERYKDIRLTMACHAAANLCAVVLSFSRLQF